MADYPPRVGSIYALLYCGEIPCLALKVLGYGFLATPGVGSVNLFCHCIELRSGFRVKSDCRC